MKATEVIWQFFNGKFGKYSLNRPFRSWWKTFWVLVGLFLFIRYGMFTFFEWWDSVVDRFNDVIWAV